MNVSSIWYYAFLSSGYLDSLGYDNSLIISVRIFHYILLDVWIEKKRFRSHFFKSPTQWTTYISFPIQKDLLMKIDPQILFMLKVGLDLQFSSHAISSVDFVPSFFSEEKFFLLVFWSFSINAAEKFYWENCCISKNIYTFSLISPSTYGLFLKYFFKEMHVWSICTQKTFSFTQNDLKFHPFNFRKLY